MCEENTSHVYDTGILKNNENSLWFALFHRYFTEFSRSTSRITLKC